MFGYDTTYTHVHGPSLMDRILHRDRSTTVVESHSTTVTTTSVLPQFSLSNLLKGGAVGGAAGGLLGGFSLLAHARLPLLGKITSLAGLGRLAGLGAGVGIAAMAYPALKPTLDMHPGLKAAVHGAMIGATAGLFLPLLSPVFGAVVGAAVGFGVHAWRAVDTPLGYPVPYGDAGGWGQSGCPAGYVPAGYYPGNTGIVPPWMGGTVPYLQPAAGYGMLRPYAAEPFGMSPYGPSPYVLGLQRRNGAIAAQPAGSPAAVAVAGPHAAAQPRRVAAHAATSHAHAHAATARPKPKPTAHAVAAARPPVAQPAMVGALPGMAAGAPGLYADPGAYLPAGMMQSLPYTGASPYAVGGSPYGPAASPYAMGNPAMMYPQAAMAPQAMMQPQMYDAADPSMIGDPGIG